MSIKSLCVFAFVLAGACQREGNMDNRGQARESGAASTTPQVQPVSMNTAGPTVLFFGTSLTAGYGLQADQAFPAVVQKNAAQDGLPINVVNAGLSGETSAGALRRIDWVLRAPADVIVIETGANDALRGLSVDAARANVDKIVARAKQLQPKAKILLVEMLAPPNLGSTYTTGFQKIYASVAKQEKVMLIPFFLDGVAGHPELNQEDGVHPNAAGARLVADHVWKVLRPIIAGLKRSH